jgi:hypothetical protein
VTTSTLEPPPEAPPASEPVRSLRWWKEMLFVGVFYALYTGVRDLRGSRPVSRIQAFHNAQRVMDVERLAGFLQEQRIQHLFISWAGFIGFWDVFYGTAHFVITILAMVWLFHRQPRRFPLWRNTLAFTTALALIGFAFFPLMPPRLLPDSFHFVDTLHTIGGLWSFDSGAMSKISNQYAAMPSLHFAWSSWTALVLGPVVKPRWAKALVYAYPFVTLFCIVVTGNHYILDAVGGAVVLGLGFTLGSIVARQLEERAARRRRGRASPGSRRPAVAGP